MKWFVSVSEFDPFGPIKFGKSRRATWLKYFIPIQVSGGLNWKLATWLVKSQVSMLYEPHNGKAMWKILEILYLEKELFGFMHLWATIMGMNGAPPPTLYPDFPIIDPGSFHNLVNIWCTLVSAQYPVNSNCSAKMCITVVKWKSLVHLQGVYFNCGILAVLHLETWSLFLMYSIMCVLMPFVSQRSDYWGSSGLLTGIWGFCLGCRQ